MDTDELDKILAAEMPPKSWITITRCQSGKWYVRVRFGPDEDLHVKDATSPFEGLSALLVHRQESKE